MKIKTWLIVLVWFMACRAPATGLLVSTMNGTATNLQMFNTNVSGYLSIGGTNLDNQRIVSSNAQNTAYLQIGTNRNLSGGSNGVEQYRISPSGQAMFGGIVSNNGVASGLSHAVGSLGNASTIGSSPASWTNVTAVALEVYFTQSTTYTVSKNGIGVYGSVAGDAYLVLQPGSYFTCAFAGSGPVIATNGW